MTVGGADFPVSLGLEVVAAAVGRHLLREVEVPDGLALARVALLHVARVALPVVLRARTALDRDEGRIVVWVDAVRGWRLP